MGVLHFILLGLLAALLTAAAVTDWRSRTIANGLNLAIAAAAPLWWLATGLDFWPGVAMQLAAAAGALVVFGGLFAIGAMGGGDVKMIVALALWFPLVLFGRLLFVMAIVGGLLTLAMLIVHRLRRAPGQPEIPYGIAIAVAGLWSIAPTLS